MFRIYHTNGVKAISIGQRPMFKVYEEIALKGRKP